jgi:hypothetical protein
MIIMQELYTLLDSSQKKKFAEHQINQQTIIIDQNHNLNILIW